MRGIPSLVIKLMVYMSMFMVLIKELVLSILWYLKSYVVFIKIYTPIRCALVQLLVDKVIILYINQFVVAHFQFKLKVLQNFQPMHHVVVLQACTFFSVDHSASKYLLWDIVNSSHILICTFWVLCQFQCTVLQTYRRCQW